MRGNQAKKPCRYSTDCNNSFCKFLH
jgi:hypothetical protein